MGLGPWGEVSVIKQGWLSYLLPKDGFPRGFFSSFLLMTAMRRLLQRKLPLLPSLYPSGRSLTSALLQTPHTLIRLGGGGGGSGGGNR
uniref:Uncharacterized protein n=1 Tax=Catagonus wagneri TaxID=51154 RepID=A0A8C3VU41_9CETA